MFAGGCLYGKLNKQKTNSERLVHAYLQCKRTAAVLIIVLCMQAATQTSRNLACNQSGQPQQTARYSQQHRMHIVSSVEHQLGAPTGFACSCVFTASASTDLAGGSCAVVC